MAKDSYVFDEQGARRIVNAVRWVERFRHRSGSGGGSSKHHRRQGPALYELIGDVNPQTGTTYTIAEDDWGKLISLSNSGTKAITLPQAGLSNGFPALWWCQLRNGGTGLATITPTTSTIDGAATTTVRNGDSTIICSDGTNYFTAPGVSLVRVRKNSGSETGRRPRLNFIEGQNITLTVTDDSSSSDEVDVTIAALPGAGGYSYIQEGSGTTTANYGDNVIASTNLLGKVALKNSGGVNTLEWRISYTSAFGTSATTSAFLVAGAEIAFEISDDIAGNVGPHSDWVLEVRNGTGATTFAYRSQVV